MPFPMIDLSRVRTYSIIKRSSRVALENMVGPEITPHPFENPEFDEVVAHVIAARRAGAPVICMFGGHVVKRGLVPVLIHLLERGVITHLASNGAAAIHDFEIGLIGQTSEDVATSLEDGSFGMAEETGAFMNLAIQAGVRMGLGAGEAIGRWMSEDDRFNFRQYSLLYHAYRLGIPYTLHIALGTDIIHQHPRADFAAIGWASGQDFKIFTAAVSGLEGGVFLNFGSAVIGPEVFLKALSISRNLGYTVKNFTTANFDLVPLRDNYHKPIGDEDPEYYYRPRKNIVNRPHSLGGKGYHITGDHLDTIPNLAARTLASLGTSLAPTSQMTTHHPLEGYPKAAAALQRIVTSRPGLAGYQEPLAQAFCALVGGMRCGGTLFVCNFGNARLTVPEQPERLQVALPHYPSIQPGERDFSITWASVMQPALRQISLGCNPLLEESDSAPGIRLAKELFILARSGDVVIALVPPEKLNAFEPVSGIARMLNLMQVILASSQPHRAVDTNCLWINLDHTEQQVLAFQALVEMLSAELLAAQPE